MRLIAHSFTAAALLTLSAQAMADYYPVTKDFSHNTPQLDRTEWTMGFGAANTDLDKEGALVTYGYQRHFNGQERGWGYGGHIGGTITSSTTEGSDQKAQYYYGAVYGSYQLPIYRFDHESRLILEAKAGGSVAETSGDLYEGVEAGAYYGGGMVYQYNDQVSWSLDGAVHDAIEALEVGLTLRVAY